MEERQGRVYRTCNRWKKVIMGRLIGADPMLFHYTSRLCCSAVLTASDVYERFLFSVNKTVNTLFI